MAVRSLFSTFSNFDGPDGWVVCPYRCPGSLGLFRGSLAPVSWSTEPQAVGCSGPSADRPRASVEPFEATYVNFGPSYLNVDLAPPPRHSGKRPGPLWEVLGQFYRPIRPPEAHFLGQNPMGAQKRRQCGVWR